MQQVMTEAHKADVAYIAKATKLSLKKAKSLTEEETDLTLLLNTICAENLEKDDFKRLSFPIYCRLVIYKLITDPEINLSDKSFIANAIALNHPLLKKTIDFKIIGDLKKTSPEAASYCLVLSGLHHSKLKIDFFSEKHEIFMNEGFRKAERLNLGHKVKEVVEVLRQAKLDGWFR